MALLELKNISLKFGKLQAINNLDMSIEKGEIHSIIGPNGAGKTTVFNIITGTYRPNTGKVIFNGEDIANLPPHQIAQRGISRSFQQSLLFQWSNVMDNMLIGFHTNCHVGGLKEFLHTRSARNADKRIKQEALEILEFMGLSQIASQMPKNLPHGHQRALGVCIALACRPTLLLLDEPVAGMNPTEGMAMVDRIRKIRDQGITVILVEHSMKVVMNISDRITVLNFGQKIAEGLPQEVRQNEKVIEAYLGSGKNKNVA